jgi:LmbE family N-acetylglucosaminyl deacetylase
LAVTKATGLLKPGQRLVAVSPHLDDAVFSIGGLLADLSSAGVEVANLTVFAGDPTSTHEAGAWDRHAGFSTAGAAARGRRAEDERACRLLGVKPLWLPFHDYTYPDDRQAAWDAMHPILADADVVVIPGFPLAHNDHAWVTAMLAENRSALPTVALYAEQPYAEAAWFKGRQVPDTVGGDHPFADLAIDWTRLRPSAGAWLRKQRAFWAYRSQLRAMARPAARVPLRVAVYELWRGGECLGIPVREGEEKTDGR